MRYKFVAMNEEYAEKMIESWKYPGEYSVYNYSDEAEELLNENNWGYSKFAVLDKKDVLVGELTIEFFSKEAEEDNDGYIDRETYVRNTIEEYQMWVGFGLRPDLTGKGYGREFVLSCIEFAVECFVYKGEDIRLAVSDKNKRAVKTYKKAGFEIFDCIINQEDSNKILRMRKLLI